MTSEKGDVVFFCPACQEPVIAPRTAVLTVTVCPHCREELAIPDQPAINKETFREPPRLRRVYDDLRDQDRANLRRQLDIAVKYALDLQAKLTRSEAELARLSGKPVRPQMLNNEVDLLKKQVVELNHRIQAANQAFGAGRKQHEVAIERLREELNRSKTETGELKEGREDLLLRLRLLSAELDRQKQLNFTLQRTVRSADFHHYRAQRPARARRR